MPKQPFSAIWMLAASLFSAALFCPQLGFCMLICACFCALHGVFARTKSNISKTF